MTALPTFTTPDELADHLGWSPRRVRTLARGLGACRIMGNRMVLLPEDVVFILKAARPGVTVDDVKDWLAADQLEMLKEKEWQSWNEPTGKVYFLGQNDKVKIGYTTDMSGRLSRFRTAAADEYLVLLTISGTPDLEVYFHDKFSEQRVVREWFRLDGPIQEFIARRTRSMRGSAA